MRKLIIIPEQFREKFIHVVSRYEKEIANLWYNSPEKYTSLMLGEKNSGGLFREVADELHLNYYQEYWTLDAVFYESKDIEYFPENSVFANYLSVVLEHENYIATTYEEMNKLTIFNSPLKVLVTYPNKENEIDKYLSEYAEILQSADIFSELYIVSD